VALRALSLHQTSEIVSSRIMDAVQLELRLPNDDFQRKSESGANESTGEKLMGINHGTGQLINSLIMEDEKSSDTLSPVCRANEFFCADWAQQVLLCLFQPSLYQLSK